LVSKKKSTVPPPAMLYGVASGASSTGVAPDGVVVSKSMTLAPRAGGYADHDDEYGPDVDL
jgi:hypothetical protein